MSGSRITELRELLKLSQQEFASRVGITQGALSQLESQKSKLSLDTIAKISRSFGVDCNWLVTGESHIFNDEKKMKSFKAEKKQIYLDQKKRGFIPLVRGEAHAGYIENYADESFLETLDVYKIPGYEAGNYRMFEVEGDSMMPTIFPGEIVVAEALPNISQVENGSLSIVATVEGIVAKRVYVYDEDRSVVILKSDNPDYRAYSVPMQDVKEIWTVRAKITSVFAQTQTVEPSRIRDLEADIENLKQQMNQLAAATKLPGFDPAV